MLVAYCQFSAPGGNSVQSRIRKLVGNSVARRPRLIPEIGPVAAPKENPLFAD